MIFALAFFLFTLVLLGALVGWALMLGAGILGVSLAYGKALPLGVILVVLRRLLFGRLNFIVTR